MYSWARTTKVSEILRIPNILAFNSLCHVVRQCWCYILETYPVCQKDKVTCISRPILLLYFNAGITNNLDFLLETVMAGYWLLHGISIQN